MPPLNTYAGNGTVDTEGNNTQNESNYGVIRLGYLGDYPPPAAAPELDIARSATGAAISWTGTGFVLQQAASVTGPWQNSTLPVDTTGGINTVNAESTGAQQFFRLIQQ